MGNIMLGKTGYYLECTDREEKIVRAVGKLAKKILMRKVEKVVDTVDTVNTILDAIQETKN